MGDEVSISLGTWNDNPYDINKSHYNLWGAVLHLGVYDFRCAASKLGRLPQTSEEIVDLEPYHLRQAIRWLFCDDFLPGSYSWVCGMLGIDHRTLRRRVIRMCEQADWSGLFINYNVKDQDDGKDNTRSSGT